MPNETLDGLKPLPHHLWWRRLRPRLSLRGLMLLVLVIGGCLGWLIHRGSAHRAAVRAIEATGGSVSYDFQRTFDRSRMGAPPGPRWLVDFLGVDFFADVSTVTLMASREEAILANVSRLDRLETLAAEKIRVTDAGLAQLAGLAELRVLACTGTPGLTDAGLANLAGLELLEGLAIFDGSRIEGPGLANLVNLKRLKVLRIATETDAGLDSLAQFTALRRLILGRTRVTDEAIAQLSRLTLLEDLTFGGEADAEVALSPLKALTQLEKLQVWGPWFTDAGLDDVAEMDHLTFFSISDTTSVTSDGLSRLQQRRPLLYIGINGTNQVPRSRTNALRAAVK